MKIIRILIFIFSALTVFSVGMWVGIETDIYAIKKEEAYAESIKPVIAVVNQDIGANNNGKRENYSEAIIQKLNAEEFVLVSPQAAQEGYDKGEYCAVVSFPSTLSQEVVDINSISPTKVNIEFIINNEASEETYINAYTKIVDLQYNVNQMLSYMYVYSLYTEVHLAQDQVGELFENDEDDMEALGQVQLQNFTEELELGNIPRPEMKMERLSFNEYVSQVHSYATEISDLYLGGYAEAKKDYKVFGEHLGDLAKIIEDDTNAWLSGMNKWATEVIKYDDEVTDYGKQMNDWKDTAVIWHDEMLHYKEYVNGFYREVEEFKANAAVIADATSSWKSRATAWAKNILTAENNSIKTYNQNYEKLNQYKMSLIQWEQNLNNYARSGNYTNPAPSLVLPQGFSMPSDLNELGESNAELIGACPEVSDESIERFTTNIDAPPDLTVIIDIPEIPVKPELEMPEKSERLQDAIFEMSTAVYDYDPEDYLTPEIREKTMEYVSLYSDHTYKVKDDMDNNLHNNIAMLDKAYDEYNTYVSELREKALSCHEKEQKNLDDALNIFYTAKTATSAENKELLGKFQSMMPNSRKQDVLNIDVLEFTVTPVNFINANIRAEDQKGLQAELLEITKICSLVVLFVLCVFLIIFICVTLSAKKDKKYSEDD